MPTFIDSLIVLALLLVVARYIKRGSKLLKHYFIPSSLVAGAGGLLLGPQVFGAIQPEIVEYWALLPEHLITIVFAGLFLGKFIPGRKQIWRQSGPMIAFGNTLAWGQYVIGILLTLVFLTPVFGVNPLAGSLIEMSFEGGHGSVAGLAPTLQQLGWSEGTDIALGLATFSIIAAILSGVLIINIRNKRAGRELDAEAKEQEQRRMIRSGYNLLRFSERFNANPQTVIINILAFAAAIGIGVLLLKGLVFLENAVLGSTTSMRFFQYMPLFPMAMLGGLIVQLGLKAIHKQHLIQRHTAKIISAIALDLLVASAIATVSLSIIGKNLPIFITFSLAGTAWILLCFLFLAPRMFKNYWFENGLTNTGQSMGMTATGLLLNRLADPSNKAKARESFAYKQLVFEPFMGGGLVTATAAIAIYEFGAPTMLAICAVVLVFWLILGLKLGRKTDKT